MNEIMASGEFTLVARSDINGLTMFILIEKVV
jgi:hypothetical protein